MSGYQSTELILATLERPVAPRLEAIRGYLEHEHAAQEQSCFVIEDPYGPEGPSECWERVEPTGERIAEAIEIGYGVRLDMDIRVARFTHPAMLCVVPVGEREVSFTLKLASSVIDAIYAYDRSMEDFDEEAKRGLVALCLGLTTAAGAPGFLLQRDELRLSPITAQEIVAELRVRVRDWQIGGLTQSLLPLHELRRHEGSKSNKYIYASVSGLTVYDLVHPVKW